MRKPNVGRDAPDAPLTYIRFAKEGGVRFAVFIFSEVVTEMQEHISCRAAAFIIKENRILMAKNANHPCYYVVGGGIEIGESSEEAIVREIFEETGLKLEVDRLAVIQERFYEANNQKHQEIVFFYLMKYNANINIPDNSFTDQGARETLHWLPVNDLEQFNIVPSFIKTKRFDCITSIEHIISYD